MRSIHNRRATAITIACSRGLRFRKSLSTKKKIPWKNTHTQTHIVCAILLRIILQVDHTLIRVNKLASAATAARKCCFEFKFFYTLTASKHTQSPFVCFLHKSFSLFNSSLLFIPCQWLLIQTGNFRLIFYWHEHSWGKGACALMKLCVYCHFEHSCGF